MVSTEGGECGPWHLDIVNCSGGGATTAIKRTRVDVDQGRPSDAETPRERERETTTKTKTMVKMMMGRLAIAAAIALVAASACASAEKSYSFERDGTSSVSYTGQTARLNMADELYDGMKSNESTVDMLLQQFNNGTGFADPALDESGKNIADKVASGCAREKNAAAKEKLEDNIKDFANNVIPAWNTPAADGTPGVLSDSKRTVNVNAKGWEMVQIFQKSLIGAFNLDQIVNNYIEPCKLDDDGRKEENDAGTMMKDKGFTRMEHAWDEAFG